MLKLDTELYEKHYYLVAKFKYSKKIKLAEFEEYKAFLDEKYCEVVHRYYSIKSTIVQPEKYITASLKNVVNEFIIEQIKNRREIPVESETLDMFLKEEGAGYINKNSPLFQGMDKREICFILLSAQAVKYLDIAKDFECSLRTVNTVISKAKEKIKHNAQKMGYKI